MQDTPEVQWSEEPWNGKLVWHVEPDGHLRVDEEGPPPHESLRMNSLCWSDVGLDEGPGER